MEKKVEIKLGRLGSLVIDMPDEFMGNLLEEYVECDYKCIALINSPHELMVYVTLFQDGKEVTGDFKHKMQILWTYSLSPKYLVYPKDIYECLKQTRDRLQEICAAMFSKQNAFIEIKIPSFEDAEGDITLSLEQTITR